MATGLSRGAEGQRAAARIDGAIARLADASDALHAWRAEGERRAEEVRQSLLDVRNHANDLTGQTNTRNRAAAQGERSRVQHSQLATGAAKLPQEHVMLEPQHDVDPAEAAVLIAEEHLQDVRIAFRPHPTPRAPSLPQQLNECVPMPQYTRAMARSADRLRRLCSATEGIPAAVEPLYGKLARSRQRWNESCNPLIVLLSWGGKDGTLHQLVLEKFSVRRLWLLRSVSKQFDAWCRIALEALPRPMVLGGGLLGDSSSGKNMVRERLRSVERLNLASMRWEKVT